MAAASPPSTATITATRVSVPGNTASTTGCKKIAPLLIPTAIATKPTPMAANSRQRSGPRSNNQCASHLHGHIRGENMCAGDGGVQPHLEYDLRGRKGAELAQLEPDRGVLSNRRYRGALPAPLHGRYISCRNRPARRVGLEVLRPPKSVAASGVWMASMLGMAKAPEPAPASPDLGFEQAARAPRGSRSSISTVWARRATWWTSRSPPATSRARR
jgi:hypothetical protein